MQLGNLPWTQVEKHTGKVIVVPTGSFEQHGHHLPLLTDSMIGSAIANRAEAALGDSAVFLPIDRKSTRLNSSHGGISRMPSSA